MRGGKGEDALSEIIGFVLILALVVVASTLYLMYVVPAEGREDEITHMNKVQDRFVSYKTSVDGLWLRSLSEFSATGTRGVSLSTSFDLGTGGGNTQSTGLFLSFMKPIGTAAKMRTQANSGDRISITVDGTPLYVNEALPESDLERNFIPLGSLSYHTDNYYWIQQIYSYKLGGVFLEQPNEGISVKVAPALSLYQYYVGSKDTVKLNLCLVNPTASDQTVGGTGPLRLETRLRENAFPRFRDQSVNNVKVEVRSDPADPLWHTVWMQALNDAAHRYDLPTWAYKISESEDGTTAVLEFPSPDPAETPPAFDARFDLTEAPLQVTFEYDES